MWQDRKQKILKNKRYFKVLNKYSHILVACAKQVMRTYNMVPITYLDLFNASIERFVYLYEQFNPDLGIPIENYLVHTIRVFMLGYATSFTSKNNQISNFSVPLEELPENLEFSVDTIREEFELQDIYKRLTSPLDEVELEIFEMFFLEDKPPGEIAKKIGITTQKVNDFVRSTNAKLRSFF
ncbi:sigma-70 family RNA polymerase sigma factor [Mycoplasma sp. 'Moose RK']|uniref:sigma-70 family RNA polymerase sigma factor n=1 Tax=Mycoplasma sp. 'Moose RK' TaxID=2780095 RepID=UPI0018C34192|nr:sigma-70 family RNA polymerase sigma factor [Mycoplasma sp. 'Moose RK']MBG0730647.1 sigma-70 family RNA polymerase sigma factor [Mycoplasma sp. 'Moose RK']